MLSVLVIGLLLTWTWRFRREFWHRNNVLLLLSLLLLFSVFALKLTAERAWVPYALPLAAVGMLVTVLLDAGVAMVMTALIAILAAAVNGAGLELAAYVMLGGMAGIVGVRRGDKLSVFVQAGIGVFVVQALVVVTFALLGDQDVRGVLELVGAAAVSAGGATVAAVGSFAVIGSVFGIVTVFQLLELANPSQPLLRRLLVETPGTYHHSLMVGNLAERAAESIGGDPLLARVAAYYHDVGKLSNPAAFIENQAGGDNIHDELDPETSAQLLKSHIGAGIDIAYKSGLPKALIAFIPQHHGTAVMSYFYARAREQAAAPFGGLENVRTPSRRALSRRAAGLPRPRDGRGHRPGGAPAADGRGRHEGFPGQRAGVAAPGGHEPRPVAGPPDDRQPPLRGCARVSRRAGDPRGGCPRSRGQPGAGGRARDPAQGHPDRAPARGERLPGGGDRGGDRPLGHGDADHDEQGETQAPRQPGRVTSPAAGPLDRECAVFDPSRDRAYTPAACRQAWRAQHVARRDAPAPSGIARGGRVRDSCPRR